jgi:hypothetical protein
MPDRRDAARPGPEPGAVNGRGARPAGSSPRAPDLPAEFDRLRAPSPAYAPRKVAVYLCTREHLVPVPFAAEAETPEHWECRCGQPATLVKDTEPTATG